MLKFIEKEGIIFNFVTDYLMASGMSYITEDYKFEEYMAFKTYFAEQREDYESPIEKKLAEVKKRATKDGLENLLADDVAAMEQELAEYELAELDHLSHLYRIGQAL